MSTERQDGTALQNKMVKYEALAGLHRAIDNSYRRFRELARGEWERRFSGTDPSDACVSIRITVAETEIKGLPGSGFLKSNKPSGIRQKAKRSLQRFAH
jgi:hypothetical protein